MHKLLRASPKSRTLKAHTAIWKIFLWSMMVTLKATFEPWKDKVLIVNKFVSDVTNSANTTLDGFIGPDEHITSLKIGVDGAESRLLNGCNPFWAKALEIVCPYLVINKMMNRNFIPF